VPQELQEMRQVTNRKKDELSTKWLWGWETGFYDGYQSLIQTHAAPNLYL